MKNRVHIEPAGLGAEERQTSAEGSGAFTMPIQNRRCDPALDGPFVWQPTAADRRQAEANHYQSLERLAERGGMSWCEMAAIVLNKRWQKFDQAYAKAVCRDVLIMRNRAAHASRSEVTASEGEVSPGTNS